MAKPVISFLYVALALIVLGLLYTPLHSSVVGTGIWFALLFAFALPTGRFSRFGKWSPLVAGLVAVVMAPLVSRGVPLIVPDDNALFVGVFILACGNAWLLWRLWRVRQV